MARTAEPGVLYLDDNLERLRLLPSESIDLVYLDPPFFSNRSYEVIWGDEAEVRSFEDRWEGGIQVYINWMQERVVEMHRVLKDTGSLYLHCDWHASHYLKVMMDKIFGQANFVNEIVWRRTGAHNKRGRYGPIAVTSCDLVGSGFFGRQLTLGISTPTLASASWSRTVSGAEGGSAEPRCLTAMTVAPLGRENTTTARPVAWVG
ncbi:MAG: DNA-methyltransferase [Solirubrobacteraceae bacterium]